MIYWIGIKRRPNVKVGLKEKIVMYRCKRIEDKENKCMSRQTFGGF